MQITILVDNHTNIDDYYLGEPGVCYYIENGQDRILLDTGYSDVAIRNAESMKIDLSKVNKIVLSHGHDDHTRGLLFLNEKGLLEGKQVIAHPEVFEKKTYEGLSICVPYDREVMEQLVELILNREPVEISEHLIFLGEIPQMVDFEPRKIIGRRFTGKFLFMRLV